MLQHAQDPVTTHFIDTGCDGQDETNGSIYSIVYLLGWPQIDAEPLGSGLYLDFAHTEHHCVQLLF